MMPDREVRSRRALGMEVSEATEADLPALCELLAVLFAQEAEFRPDAERQTAGLRAILGHPDVGRVMVLRDEPAVVGMVSLLFVPSTALGGRVAWLEDMVVRPEYRGFGAGSRLFAAALEAARRASCLRVTLLTDRDNQDGQRFYARQGFVRSGMVPMRLLLAEQRRADLAYGPIVEGRQDG